MFVIRYENTNLETLSGRTETVELEAPTKDALKLAVATQIQTACKHQWRDIEEQVSSSMFGAWFADRVEEVEDGN